MYGIDVTGFLIKSQTEIESDIDSKIKSTFGANTNTNPNSIFGQLKYLTADEFAQLWELMQDIYISKTINASGASLDFIAQITGKVRNPAKFAQIKDLQLTVSDSLTLTAGFTFSKANDTETKFQVTATITHTHTTTANETWDINVEAITAGSMPVTTDSITVIDTPIQNLVSCTNDSGSSFINGSDKETDAELRHRIQNEPFLTIEGTDSGIRKNILKLNDDETLDIIEIENCFIIENESNVTDSDGRPPHSFEAVVYYDGAPDSATDTAIAEAIAQSKPAGIQSCSTTGKSYTATVTYDAGNSIGITFSRPADVTIYLTVNAAKADGNLSSAEKVALQTWLADWGNNLGVAQDVVIYGRGSLTSRLNDFEDCELTDYEISISTTSPAPAPTPGTTDANIDIDYTKISVWNTTNITIGNL